MSGGNETPIIVKKIKKGGHGHHGGAWKVAYADFVTAMMALFIVLWIMAQGKEVQDSVAKYFQNPLGLGQGPTVMPGNKTVVADPKLFDDNKLKEEAAKKMKEMSEEIEKEITQTPEFKEIASFVKMEMTDEGLRIEMIDSSKVSDVFFEIGTAKLNLKARHLLEKIGSELAKIPNGVVVEGHTDARPFVNAGQGYTNYDLSADRANCARQAMQHGGLSEIQILEIRGYADKKLKNKNDPNDLVNRRISIIVKLPSAK